MGSVNRTAVMIFIYLKSHAGLNSPPQQSLSLAKADFKLPQVAGATRDNASSISSH
jgi:hypothetical protein